MNQSFIIYIIQNMLLISLFILILFFIGRRVPLKAGHAWRKWLWAVLAVRLLLPVPVSVKLPVPENAAGAEEETEYSAGGSGEEAEAVPAEAASGDTAAGPEGYAARPEGSAGAGKRDAELYRGIPCKDGVRGWYRHAGGFTGSGFRGVELFL